MRRSLATCTLSIFLLLPVLTSADADGVSRAGQQAKKISGEYIVVLNDLADADAVSAKVAKKHGGSVNHVYKHALKGFSVKLSDDRAIALRAEPYVVGVFQDEEVNILAPTGPVAQAQALPTGINRINAENKVNKGAGVEVAVIDTGIDLKHPDLKANVLGGKNCVSGPNSYNDGNGHGTHVAGTIAALNNTIGVVGVAPAAKLWAVRVLNNQGSGSWSNVICGIDWVTSQASHIKVASMSLGGGGSAGTSCASSPLRQAICNSVNAGVTYVVAAGNEGADLAGSVPAAYPEVIAVSALADSNGVACGGGATTGYGADDTFASFSNYATSSADLGRLIGAPGVNIYSTWKGGGYNTISGTSMATPHVSGAAALWISTHPGSIPAQVKAALFASAEPGNVNVGNECAAGNSHAGTALHPETVLRTEAF